MCNYQVIGRKKLQLLIIVQTQEAMPNPAKPFFYSSNNLLENCSNYSESQIVLWNNYHSFVEHWSIVNGWKKRLRFFCTQRIAQLTKVKELTMSLAISDIKNFTISLKEQIYIDTALVLYIIQVKIRMLQTRFFGPH